MPQRAFYENGNEIPNHLVEKEIASGRAFFDAEDDIVLSSETGTPITVKGSEVPGLLASNKATFVTPAELQEYEARKESESPLGMLRTGAAGLARGLSLGFSDAALVGAGADPEAIVRDREVNPGTAIGSEIVGAVAPVLATGGGGAAAGAGRLAGAARLAELAPASLLARAGSAVGRAGEAALIRTGAPRGFARAAGFVAEGMTEGAVAGLGGAVSDASLGDHELNAEMLLAAAGKGALFGGAVTGGLLAAKGVGKLLTGQLVSDAVGGAIVDHSLLGKTIGKKVAPAYAKASSKVLKGEADDFQRMFSQGDEGVAFRFNAINEKELVEDAAESVAQKLKKVADVEKIDASKRVTDAAEPALNLPKRPTTQATKAAEKAAPAQEAATRAEAKVSDPIEWDSLSSPKEASRLADEAEVPDIVKRLEERAQDYSQRLEAGGLSKAETTRLEGARDAARSAQEEVKHMRQVRRDADTYRRVEALQESSGVASFFAETGADVAVGLAAGGIPGGIAGAAAGRLYQPTTVMERMVRLEQIRGQTRRVANKISRSLDRTIRQKTSFSAQARAVEKRRKTGLLAASTRLFGEKREERKVSFERREKQIHQWKADPIQAAENWSSRVVGPTMKDTAPRITAAAAEHYNRAMTFLADKLPEKPNLGGFQGHLTDIPITGVEIDRFARYSTAVENPVSVVDDLENGQLTPEAVEAIKATSPKLYEAIRETALDKLTSAKERMPYQARLQLSMLLDLPGDATLDPQFMARTQDIFQQNSAAQNKPPPPSRMPTAKPRTAEFAATGSEKVANNV